MDNSEGSKKSTTLENSIYTTTHCSGELNITNTTTSSYDSEDRRSWNLPVVGPVQALVIVAHPDDETIFCGGTILNYKDWNWTVICATFKEEDPRGKEFETAMAKFRENKVNIKGILVGIDERDFKFDKKNECKKKIAGKIIDLELHPDIVFTHNKLGEYNHEAHRLLYEIVHEIISEYCPNVWEFICTGSLNYPQPFKSRIKVVPFKREGLKNYEIKAEIFNESYTTQLYWWKDFTDIMLYEFKAGPEIFTSE